VQMPCSTAAWQIRCLTVNRTSSTLLNAIVCRELWHRASLALRSILAAEPGHEILVVAHNAVNQVVVSQCALCIVTFQVQSMHL
jgi:broad specificity phosphatase PhoE